MNDRVQESGLFASSRRLFATFLEMAQVRLDLFGTEVELEKRRLFDGMLWAALALLVLGIGLLLLCGFVTLLLWEGYRLAAVGVLALLFLTLGALLMREARQRLRNPISMFKASLTELAQDQAGLRSSNQHDQQ